MASFRVSGAAAVGVQSFPASRCGHLPDRRRRTTAASTPTPASSSSDKAVIRPKAANASPPRRTAASAPRPGPRRSLRPG